MNTTATVRMHSQENQGDCFFVMFSRDDKKSWVMIDFGSYTDNDEKRGIAIAKEIKEALNGVPVHGVWACQSQDQLSGFITAAGELKDLPISGLWLSSADDTRNMFGMEDKHGDVAGEQTDGQATSNLTQWLKETKFLTAGDTFDMPGMEDAVKVYVLGPATNAGMLKNADTKNGKDGAPSAPNNAPNFLAAVFNNVTAVGGVNMYDKNFPFNEKYIMNGSYAENLDVRKMYEKEGDEWRRIDTVQTEGIGNIVLHNNLTIDTSLVLAFEIADTGRVLLFADDAQVGNWKSWFDVKFRDSDVTAEQLLKRTVLYKAGHRAIVDNHI